MYQVAAEFAAEFAAAEFAAAEFAAAAAVMVVPLRWGTPGHLSA